MIKMFFSRVIFIPVFLSILMTYTVALAKCYGRLISELKRQIEMVSQADFPGEGLYENTKGEHW